MRLLLFIGVLFLFSSAKAYTIPPHYMTFSYERATYPGDGETVSTPGNLVMNVKEFNRVTYALNFTSKSDDFKRLGGWMVDVALVVIEVPLISEESKYSESYYGSAEGTAILVKADNSKYIVSATCLQTKAEKARIINCFLNGFDSVTATIPQ